MEVDEAFRVQLSNPSGATVAKSIGTVTIVNDDYRSRVSLVATDADKPEGDRGRTTFSFAVERIGDLADEVVVRWAVAGTGANRADRFDFIGGLPTGTVRIASGRSRQPVFVNVFCDRIGESDEQFTVTIVNAVGNSVGLVANATSANGMIRNDDSVAPRPSTPIQSQAFAVTTGSDMATMRVIAAQSFAAIADLSGSSSTSNPKRVTFA